MSIEEYQDFTTVYINGFYEGEKKWKDKIRAKIKELEGQEDWYREHESLDELYGRIDELKGLLEEE